MYNICVFAGTTEGRAVVEFLSGQPVQVTACVATEYGELMLPEKENITVSVKRLDENEMACLFQEQAYDLVIDATHPYAYEVTENIKGACDRTETPYVRLLRSGSAASNDAVFLKDIPAVVDFLNQENGVVLLTTGSKELAKYKDIRDFEERVYARVLPTESSLQSCRDAGVKLSHIIAMQGPFTEEMNVATLKSIGASFMVTKDSGDAGGFDEKVKAAKEAGARMLVIGRQIKEEGLSLSEVLKLLSERFSFAYQPEVVVAGIGPGNMAAMTQEVLDAIKEADCLIGAKRMLENKKAPHQGCFAAIAPDMIRQIIDEHPEYRSFTVLMSGDTGFYSGTKKLLDALKGCQVKVLPGLSSLAYLAARLNISYEDAYVTSLHGRDHDIIPDVKSHKKVFVLVGGENGIGRLCRTLCDGGLKDVAVHVGEQLSYDEEKLTSGTAEELKDRTFASLSAAFIINDHPDQIVTQGLPDSAFKRGESEGNVVPMTKSEVRSVSLSKLRLTADAVCWDVGAGTGSVAIEMALQAKDGTVYAIERKEDACALIEENSRNLRAANVVTVAGTAPWCCEELPAPTHAFIGGSSGNMKEIISLLIKKNPDVRIVATAITLESVSELTACMKAFKFKDSEVVSMTVASSRKAGPYHLMMGQNPVYIYTFQYPEVTA